jgi:hypothetical protein
VLTILAILAFGGLSIVFAALADQRSRRCERLEGELEEAQDARDGAIDLLGMLAWQGDANGTLSVSASEREAWYAADYATRVWQDEQGTTHIEAIWGGQ